MPTLPTVADIVNQMRRQLAVADPELDTSIGKPVRKILDAVGEVIFESQVDRYLLDYLYDVDTKVGSDLDQFLALFGFARLEAKRATGVITFSRNSPATQDYFIPFAAQISTTDLLPIIVQTTASAILGVGESEIEVPAQMVLGGGNGNVQSNTVVSMLTTIPGVNAVTNNAAFTGGTDAEDDDTLRRRYKATAFRNHSGTESMFRGISLEDPDVTQANVVGSSKQRFEQLETVAGTATSEVQDSIYTYPDSAFFGTSISQGDLLVPGVHYDFDPQDQPVITLVSGVSDGIYELEFAYLSRASRNDPVNGITNRIDVWVNGMRIVEATESLIFDDGTVFNNTSGDPLYRMNFQRRDASSPTDGNLFIRFGFSPIVSVPNQLTIGATTFDEGTDYWLVNNITSKGMAPRSYAGIEWKSVANGGTEPSDGTAYVVTYNYNEVPTAIEAAMEQWRLVGSDLWVHQAVIYYLDIWIAVIAVPGWDTSVVTTQLAQVISNYLNAVEFNGVVQVSDLIAVAHSINGVDAIRLFTDDDHATNFGIARVDPDDSSIITNYNDGGTPARAIDLALGDDETVVLNTLHVDYRAQNSFGVV